VRLDLLPPDHPLRNTPLAVIKATYQWERGQAVRTVLPSYGIAGNTFNELGDVWTNGYIWEVSDENSKIVPILEVSAALATGETL
jgi:hypothetical protein